MSTKDTEKLNPSDLKYLLIDSLRLYSDNVIFLDGNNPYRFSINKKTYYVFIKNIHESGEGRDNQDECRIQVAKSINFNEALNSENIVIVLGYFADEKIFTAWNPFKMKDRFNTKDNISIYSRFSIQKEAVKKKIAVYIDNNGDSAISFRPDYLGLYLDNIKNMHLYQEEELRSLALESDVLNAKNQNGNFISNNINVKIQHERISRDPQFRKNIYDAYFYKCAMCGMQLELIEAAHIVPYSHELGNDETSNGVCLCALHHTAYDRSLIYFDEKLKILINEEKVKYLEKVGLDSGMRKFEKLAFEELQIPKNHTLRPNIKNIKIANQIRGII